MLRLTGLALRRGTRLLFEGVDLTVHRGEKLGIVGANGCGKSSLLALVRGELQPDAGDLRLSTGLTLSHVAQETPAVDDPAIEYVMDGDNELRAAQRALAQAEACGDGHRQAEWHGRLEAIGGYTARTRAARLMHGLGFRPEQDEVPVSTLSGGWRMRLNLARALMCRSDLLLLDEPTNHLDLDAVLWLEDWLRAYPGALMLISHDRDFLDRVVDHMVHMEHQRIRRYPGNYSAFERQRAAQLANQQAAYHRQQREIRHIQRFVQRFRAKATKARQAQSRLKALERMELIAPAHVDSPFHFEFRAPERLPHPLLRLERAAAGYGETPVIQRVELALSPGQRIGLLGRNGAGKSTLIKLLAGGLAPLAGSREPAKGLETGYFAQHQLEQLDPRGSPLGHLQRLDGRAAEQPLRDYLGGFGFEGERAETPVAPFSGGEKARLVLALVVYRRPNLLLLDEPTNHLDLEMRHALTMALQGFEGAVVLVSHDRHLLLTVTDELLLVHDGAVSAFEGDLDEYPRWLARSREASAPQAGGGPKGHLAAARKTRRREEAERRRRLQPLRSEANRLDGDLERLCARQAALERRLGEPDIYEESNRDELRSLLQERGELARALHEAEEAWLQACEALETAQTGSDEATAGK
jgi:ATP-binding cassette subfamily F protein 3